MKTDGNNKTTLNVCASFCLSSSSLALALAPILILILVFHPPRCVARFAKFQCEWKDKKQKQEQATCAFTCLATAANALHGQRESASIRVSLVRRLTCRAGCLCVCVCHMHDDSFIDRTIELATFSMIRTERTERAIGTVEVSSKFSWANLTNSTVDKEQPRLESTQFHLNWRQQIAMTIRNAIERRNVQTSSGYYDSARHDHSRAE